MAVMSSTIELSGLDIFLFVAALAVSVIIGVYFTNKNKTLEQYMLGGREQRLLPVAMSMMTSFMSGITMLGNPAELYYHGASYSMTAFGMIAAAPFTALILLPVFQRLGNLSVFNYLEQRYNGIIQKMVALVFVIEMVLYNALVLYVPSLSLRSVLGISENISIGVVGASCIIYSTLGGIKAVIWTDFFQAGLMLMSLMCVCVAGTLESGTFMDMLTTNQRAVATGSVITNTFTNGANQVQVQRALSLPTVRQGQYAQVITSFLTATMSFLSSYIGLILLVSYKHCDPYESHQIDKRDSIMLHYIGTHLNYLPGLRGIFVAGVYAATLSTLSSFQNSMSALVLEDFIKPSLARPLSEKSAIRLGLGLSMVFGIACVTMTFIVGRVSGLLQVATTLNGTLGAPILAIFLLGMMTRYINTAGVSAGLLVSFALGFYIQIYQTFFRPPLEPSLPLSIDRCPGNITNLFVESGRTLLVDSQQVGAFKLEEISYLWLPTLEFVVCIVVAIIVSLLSGGLRQQVDDKYLVSWIQSKKTNKSSESCEKSI